MLLLRLQAYFFFSLLLSLSWLRRLREIMAIPLMALSLFLYRRPDRHRHQRHRLIQMVVCVEREDATISRRTKELLLSNMCSKRENGLNVGQQLMLLLSMLQLAMHSYERMR